MHGIFGKICPKRLKPTVSSEQFRRVCPTPHIAEYRGVLGPMPSTIKHHLWCVRVEHRLAVELVKQGFRGVGRAGYPTHSIFCVAKMGGKNPHTRIVFSLHLALHCGADGSSALSNDYANSVAERVTSRIAAKLKNSTERAFVFRCINPHEYPWCMSPEGFDEYWLIELGVHYRSVLRNTVPF
jgi:hypothetical protein